ncbi:MAG: hypothetical protein DVB22_000862 [Verrucomicrobia bacterium]|nr:MAG: hypothetical protein DVB22_000862 [Verrucomicrobiota bacterium]
MNPKTIAAALALLSIGSAPASEAVTLTWKKDAPENAQTAVLTLAAGESLKAVWGGERVNGGDQVQNHIRVRLSVTKGSETWLANLVDAHNFGSGIAVLNFQITGPAVIRLVPNDPTGTTVTSVATFDVTRVGTASPPAEVPQEAGSDFDVILEQSSDLVNWTPANPGTYSGTETKRFFRTRIVKK